MTRRCKLFLAALLCAVVIVAIVVFATGDWVVQTTEAIAFPTPTATSDVGNHIAPDTLDPDNDAFLYHDTGRAAPQALP